MKRAAWIALGLAAGAGAHAQTNVTIYGIVDAAFVGESGGVAGHQTKLTSGASRPSALACPSAMDRKDARSIGGHPSGVTGQEG